MKPAPPLYGINYVRHWEALAYAGLIFYPKVKKSMPQIVETCTIFIHKTVDIGCDSAFMEFSRSYHYQQAVTIIS